MIHNIFSKEEISKLNTIIQKLIIEMNKDKDNCENRLNAHLSQIDVQAIKNDEPNYYALEKAASLQSTINKYTKDLHILVSIQKKINNNNA